ncbi:MAG: hypothetical protein ABJC39_05325 [Chloroflexota bacterium]
MTAQNDLDRTLGAWFGAEAAPAPPAEPLARILETTRARRPRPSLVADIGSHWVVAGGSTTGVRGGIWGSGRIGLTPLGALLLLLALLSALGGAFLLAGSHRTLPAVVAPTASPTSAPTPAPSIAPVAVASPEGPSDPPLVFPSPSLEPAPGQAVQTRVSDTHYGQGEPLMVTLADGRVLIVSNVSGVPGEVFDPSTGRFTVTDPGRATGEGGGVLLRDGRALLVMYDSNAIISTVFLFDPMTMSWAPVDAPGYQGGERDADGLKIRRYPTLTLLHDGRVLLSGGEVNLLGGGEGTVVESAALFDPVTETISPTGSMVHPRMGHSATMMADGRVLVAGGWGPCPRPPAVLQSCGMPDLRDAEIYDPATGAFTPTGGMSSIQGANEGLSLPDGRVLVLPIYTDGSGGVDGLGPVEIYDPSSETFALAATTPYRVRTATLLPDGRVFLTAQWNGPGTADKSVPMPLTTWAGVFDPTTGLTQVAPAPPTKSQRAAALPDGRILLVGGEAGNWAELYSWP